MLYGSVQSWLLALLGCSAIAIAVVAVAGNGLAHVLGLDDWNPGKYELLLISLAFIASVIINCIAAFWIARLYLEKSPKSLPMERNSPAAKIAFSPKVRNRGRPYSSKGSRTSVLMKCPKTIETAASRIMIIVCMGSIIQHHANQG